MSDESETVRDAVRSTRGEVRVIQTSIDAGVRELRIRLDRIEKAQRTFISNGRTDAAIIAS